MGGRIRPEWVAGFNRNQWPDWAGIRTEPWLCNGHPSFVMSASFANQVLAQLELHANAES
jgi:hypothetical protein